MINFKFSQRNSCRFLSAVETLRSTHSVDKVLINFGNSEFLIAFEVGPVLIDFFGNYHPPFVSEVKFSDVEMWRLTQSFDIVIFSALKQYLHYGNSSHE
jgi:hypothetical protein